MSADTSPIDKVVSWARRQERLYAHGEDRPLSGYVTTMAIYTAAVTAGAVAVRVSKRSLPEQFALGDLALLAIACHKASRLITKDPVTSPLRAPVTEYEGPSGPGELREEVRGDGAAHALGELLTCPFCTAQWIATAGMFGLVAAPKPTRFIAATFAVVAGSDFLQLLYGAAHQKTKHRS